MKFKDFSVSMCVYAGDNAEHFRDAVYSVIEQTLKPHEVVITVDGPIPNSIENELCELNDKLSNTDIQFKVVRLEKNMGHGEARRICFENCSCELIALMDADDISVPNRFEKQVNAFNSIPHLSIVGSHISEFSIDPNTSLGKRIVKLTDKDIKRDMRYRCPMNQPSVMFKKTAVKEVGGYLDWFCNEDYYLWIRLALSRKRFANIDDCLVKMRVDTKSYQRRGGIKYFKSEFAIQKLMLDHNMIDYIMFAENVLKRFIVQVCLPNSIRSWVFKKFARE